MGGPRRYLGVLALTALMGAAGCGPIEYVNQVTRKASTSVEAAKAAKADKYSPYYYTLAVEYLHKARVEAAAADFQAANRFGRLADEAAQMAQKEAIDRVGKPIEQFHPVYVPPADDADAPTTTPAPADGMAPLVEDDEELAPTDDDDGDDEVPTGLEESP